MSLERKSLDRNASGAPSSADGSNTFIRIVACGQTMAHLPQSMQMSGSQIGISWAMARFSYCAVAVGNVPSTGRADTGSRSPSPAIIGTVTRATKSGTSSGSTLRRLRCDVAVAGTSTRAMAASEASIAASLRSTMAAPRAPYDLRTDVLMCSMASSTGSTLARAKKHGCITVLMRAPSSLSRATLVGVDRPHLEALVDDLDLHLLGQLVPHLVGRDRGC